MLEEMYVKGTQVNYFFVCKTKLWLFSHSITMEDSSDAVKLGKLLHMQVFDRYEKELKIGPIAIDIIKKGSTVEIREVKKSDKLEKAHIYQTMYYVYYLKKFGVKARAILSYPKLKKTVEIEVGEKEEKEIKRILCEILEICKGNVPKPEYKSFCRKCAYYELCFS